MRNGEQAAVALDIVALMDALEIKQAVIAGFERCKGVVSVSGYLIGSRAGYAKYTNDFNKMTWQLSSPKWNFDDATFERSAASFDNPDHVDIVIHNYRWRLSLASGEAKYDDLERQLAEGPKIAVPTITMEGDANGALHAPAETYRGKFTGKYEYRLITGGIGHNLPQEAPQAFAKVAIDVDAF